MKFIRSILIATACVTVVCPAGLLAAQSTQDSMQTAPDNSKHNSHHRTTADNQPNARGDRMTTAKIRKAIIADKSLSTYAHNVKIITMNGSVTLKGPVKSDDEKQKIVADIAGVVSTDKLDNQLTVKK